MLAGKFVVSREPVENTVAKSAPKPPAYRVGFGHDTHRLVPDRRLVLGGVEIPFELGLAGHSDADVLLHAVIDAMLGAAGAGDIGEMFPDTDPRYKDVDSRELMRAATEHVRSLNWRVANVDCTVHAQRPKLSPYKPQIRESLAALLGVSLEQVNVKAKTGEHVGPVGLGEAMMADAAVLLEWLD